MPKGIPNSVRLAYAEECKKVALKLTEQIAPNITCPSKDVLLIREYLETSFLEGYLAGFKDGVRKDV